MLIRLLVTWDPLHLFVLELVSHIYNFNPILNRGVGGGGGGADYNNFSLLTSTSLGISPKIFMSFRSNPFATLVQNFKAIPSVSPKLSNMNQDKPQKKWFFWSNPYNIEVIPLF